MEDITNTKRKNAKGKILNKKAERLLSLEEDRVRLFMNGCMQGDVEGEYMYVGKRGASTIDYVIVKTEGWRETKKICS